MTSEYPRVVVAQGADVRDEKGKLIEAGREFRYELAWDSSVTKVMDSGRGAPDTEF